MTGAAALGLALLIGATAGAQEAGLRANPGHGRPPHGYDWRPAPPAVHGFWGQRRWQRYSDDIGMRTMPTSSYGDARR